MALVSLGQAIQWTWKELAERVETAAAGFLAFGLKRGTSVGVWSLNLPEWRFTQFAAPRPGFLVTIRLI